MMINELDVINDLSQDISNLIDTLSELPIEQKSFEELSRLLTERDKLIVTFFNNTSQEELKHSKLLIDYFIIKNNLLTDKATQLKNNMAKRIIEQKKNKKITEIYKNT